MGVGSEVTGEHLARAVAEKGWNRTSVGLHRVPTATAEAAVGATVRKAGQCRGQAGDADVFAGGDESACQGSSLNRAGE